MANQKHYSLQKKHLWILPVAFIALLGVITHASISSYSLERKISNFLEMPSEESDLLSGTLGMGQSVTIPLNLEVITMPRDGAYNSSSPNNDGFAVVLKKACHIALGQYPQTFGWFMPFPFLIPFAVHLGMVWILRMSARLGQFWEDLYQSDRSFGKHALFAALYAYLIMVFFQSARMFWGSEAWDGAYFVSYQYGWPAFYLFLGLCIAMYLYCVIGTAGLQVRREPTAKKQTCIKCGYGTEGVGRCPECDLEVGAFIDSKWRVNHWYLAGMFIITFFSPVFVSSVYSVLG